MILYHFNVLISTINLKNIYFDVFPNKKHSEKQLLQQPQTLP